MSFPSRPVLGLAAVALTAATALSACSSNKTSTANAASTGTGSGSSASQCGTVPSKLPSDPDGVIAALPSSLQTLYNGYPTAVYKSAFANWKPSSSTNKTVGLLLSTTNNGYQLALQALLKADLTAAGYTVDLVVSSDVVTDQVADFNQMVEKKDAVIIYEPLSGSAFTTAVDSAAAAGIPSISVLNSVDDKNTISLGANAWYQGAEMAAYIAKQIGGSGKVLDVHGISGVSIDTYTYQGVKAAFALCSGITTDDSIYDSFADATAKSSVATYLETHPQKIAAALTSGAGATGVMEGFQAAGKTVPIIGNDSLEEGQLAYWNANKSSYNGVGITTTPPSLAAATTTLVKHLLAGDGVKLSAVALNTPLVTNDNLSDWVDASWTETSTGNAGGPTTLDVLPADELSAVLTTPSS
jgi:ABC-type sugar transport system substrate-binding protein